MAGESSSATQAEDIGPRPISNDLMTFNADCAQFIKFSPKDIIWLVELGLKVNA
jgi:hypothetical protein